MYIIIHSTHTSGGGNRSVPCLLFECSYYHICTDGKKRESTGSDAARNANLYKTRLTYKGKHSKDEGGALPQLRSDAEGLAAEVYLREQHGQLLDIVVVGGRREVFVVVRVHDCELRVAASELLRQSLPIGVIEGAAIAREVA